MKFWSHFFFLQNCVNGFSTNLVFLFPIYDVISIHSFSTLKNDMKFHCRHEISILSLISFNSEFIGLSILSNCIPGWYYQKLCIVPLRVHFPVNSPQDIVSRTDELDMLSFLAEVTSFSLWCSGRNSSMKWSYLDSALHLFVWTSHPPLKTSLF